MRDLLMTIMTNNDRLPSSRDHALNPSRFFHLTLPSFAEVFQAVDMVRFQIGLHPTELTFASYEASDQFASGIADDFRRHFIVDGVFSLADS